MLVCPYIQDSVDRKVTKCHLWEYPKRDGRTLYAEGQFYCHRLMDKFYLTSILLKLISPQSSESSSESNSESDYGMLVMDTNNRTAPLALQMCMRMTVIKDFFAEVGLYCCVLFCVLD